MTCYKANHPPLAREKKEYTFGYADGKKNVMERKFIDIFCIIFRLVHIFITIFNCEGFTTLISKCYNCECWIGHSCVPPSSIFIQHHMCLYCTTYIHIQMKTLSRSRSQTQTVLSTTEYLKIDNSRMLLDMPMLPLIIIFIYFF